MKDLPSASAHASLLDGLNWRKRKPSIRECDAVEPCRDTKKPIVGKEKEVLLARIIAIVVSTLIAIGLLVFLIITISRLLWVGQVPLPTIHKESSPVPVHSHNDYWRESPLLSAVSAGCIGIEADVWAYGGELYVGHDLGNLRPGQTFSNLYIYPLLEMLLEKSSRVREKNGMFGIYDANPDQTVVLLIDIKSDPETTWPMVLNKLEPLRRHGFLSQYNRTSFVSRPVTAVVTGNANLPMLLKNGPVRDVFLDAPLESLQEDSYGLANSYYASVSFYKSIGRVGIRGLEESQISKLRDQIRGAHSRGLKARYWDLPAWPKYRRNQIWETLLEEGVDVLNVDDILEARQLYVTDGTLR